jgi:ABC-type multidrug transport system fused ATPase/permease subunit
MNRIEGDYSIPEHHLESEVMKSDVAYVPQTPWLMSASIRDNILFGEEFNEERYYSVVKACALLKDLDTLEYGDNTAVGEKGVNLSGGQKARVSLARAAYSTAPIVLLDDPLSAVDAPTARHLLQHCLLGLFRNRTVILVTHAVQLVLPQAHHVVVIKNGSVLSQGSPNEVVKDPNASAVVAGEVAVGEAIVTGPDSNTSVTEDIPLKSKEPEDHREGKASGSVKWNTYRAYLIACGGWLFAVGVFLSFSIQTGADYLSNWWVEVWTDSLQKYISTLAYSRELLVHSLMNYVNQIPIVKNNVTNENLFYISIFGLIGFAELFALLFKIVIQFYGGIRASRIMHSKLVVAVLGSPMRFFETTPVGRIINRFSKDLSDIDLTVMFTIFRFATVLLGAFVRLVLVSIVTPPFAFAFLLIYFYWVIAKYYLTTSRELKRIESVSNSPIYALFGESLNGTSTIRAYGAEHQFLRKIERRVDANHRAYFYLFATNQWLLFRNALLSCCIVLCAGISILLSGLSAGWAGVAFNFSSQITNMISNAIRTHSSLEMAMNAVERVEEYAKLNQEVIQGTRQLPENWPSEGKVQVKDLVIRYAPDLPDVLKSVSFTINPKEKIGIVGRTGYKNFI